MKFEAGKSALLDALQLASSAVPNKTTLPILYNFRLRLDGEMLEVTATDLDLTMVLKLEVQGHEDGEIVLNARKFLEVVKELPEMPVLVAVDDYVVTIRSESGFQCTLAGFDAGEYPSLPDMSEGSGGGAADRPAKVRLKDLRFLAEKTAFAVSNDFSRIALTGVFWENKGGQMIMVGTDGHRFGKAWLEGAALPEAAGVILPPKAIQQVLHMALDAEETVEVQMSRAFARFSSPLITVYSKLIEGPYPKYENVIPKEFAKRFTVNREHFMAVLRRVATMANAKTRLVVCALQAGQMLLSAKNADLGGDSEESIPLDYEAEPLELGLNAGYLLEVLRLVHTEEARFKFNGPLGAVVIEPVTEKAEYFFIVMPLRIVREA